MQRILILNGPNLNLLGIRQPDVYGTASLVDVEQACREWGARFGVGVETYQSNHEGDLIDRVHSARDSAAGIVINPGALTHYSYALHDAIEAVRVPAVEVHISNIQEREEWRRHSVVSDACVATIFGRGIDGYRWAIRHLVQRAAWPAEQHHYGNDHDQVGDLRVPEGEGPHPVVVVYHGGFWRAAWQRDLMDAVAVDLARRGYATWNVEYRRVGQGGGWTSTLDDVAHAMDHLEDMAQSHPLDLAAVSALGHSAGGHLALWTAARSGLPVGAPGAAPRVQPAGVVALAPVADLAEAHRLGLGEHAVEAFLRRSPDNGAERYRLASPAEQLPLGVSQQLIHGAEDDRVPVQMSRDYVAAATAAGDDATLVELAGVGHFELIDPGTGGWGAAVSALAATPR